MPFFYHNIIIRWHRISPSSGQLHVLATLGAQDIVAFSQEAATDQGDGALLTVEAVIVPLALLKGNVLAASET